MQVRSSPELGMIDRLLHRVLRLQRYLQETKVPQTMTGASFIRKSFGLPFHAPASGNRIVSRLHSTDLSRCDLLLR
ncbi:hypothetical protein BDQ94DRAFT_136763 [Aspergillus welwitschiae]|uniref:Uncharacterized protein n=1 Tax=Aspergillus welwitschiae TaxID=1341132 RepID=A0A3F3QF14_9EURO|nr:hypothetical protein BDQ94DRAFT_136763 [Aspergillus welwitschiae]RDH37630.1 hypothetical protein BDQ94DRAFT_136763 [Aspergillus welwitschiae]